MFYHFPPEITGLIVQKMGPKKTSGYLEIDTRRLYFVLLVYCG